VSIELFHTGARFDAAVLLFNLVPFAPPSLPDAMTVKI
jgi:hypothetical protein